MASGVEAGDVHTETDVVSYSDAMSAVSECTAISEIGMVSGQAGACEAMQGRSAVCDAANSPAGSSGTSCRLGEAAAVALLAAEGACDALGAACGCAESELDAALVAMGA